MYEGTLTVSWLLLGSIWHQAFCMNLMCQNFVMEQIIYPSRASNSLVLLGRVTNKKKMHRDVLVETHVNNLLKDKSFGQLMAKAYSYIAVIKKLLHR